MTPTRRADLLWLAGFAAYVLAQAALRLTIYGPALELDEAEAFWFARDLAPGYGAQPPLYFWLQWLFFRLFGEGVAALALLKAALLWSAAAMGYALIRRAMPPMAAGAAILALGLTPEISWEMQRALTHSVLVFTLSVAATLVTAALIARPTWAHHLLLGAVLGFGMLAKHNFALLIPPLAVAAASLPGARAALRPARLAVALLLAVALMSPYLLWIWQNPGIAGGSLHKLGIAQLGPLQARLSGLVSLAGALAGWLVLPALVLGWPVLRRLRAGPGLTPMARCLLMLMGAGLAAVVAMILLGGVSRVPGRWLVPLMWPLAPVAVLLAWPGLTARGRTGLIVGLAAVWAVIALALPLIDSYRKADFAAALAPLPDAPVVAERIWVLGNLALTFPERPVFAADAPATLPPGPALLIAAPANIAALAARLGRDVPEIQPLSLPGRRKDDGLAWALAR